MLCYFYGIIQGADTTLLGSGQTAPNNVTNGIKGPYFSRASASSAL